MSLRAEATATGQAARAAERERQAQKWEQEREKRRAWFKEKYGVDAEFVDMVDISNRVCRDRYSQSLISIDPTRYQRWQVEDVTLLYRNEYPGESVHLEGTCKQCGLVTTAGASISTPWNADTDEQKRAALVKEIGARLVPVLCTMCKENLPRQCPTCRRTT